MLGRLLQHGHILKWGYRRVMACWPKGTGRYPTDVLLLERRFPQLQFLNFRVQS